MSDPIDDLRRDIRHAQRQGVRAGAKMARDVAARLDRIEKALEAAGLLTLDQED
jgi:hypothetical protein